MDDAKEAAIEAFLSRFGTPLQSAAAGDMARAGCGGSQHVVGASVVREPLAEIHRAVLAGESRHRLEHRRAQVTIGAVR
jgi:hypothetical protein